MKTRINVMWGDESRPQGVAWSHVTVNGNRVPDEFRPDSCMRPDPHHDQDSRWLDGELTVQDGDVIAVEAGADRKGKATRVQYTYRADATAPEIEIELPSLDGATRPYLRGRMRLVECES